MEQPDFQCFRCDACRAIKPHKGRSVPTAVRVAHLVVDGQFCVSEELFCHDCVRRHLGDTS